MSVFYEKLGQELQRARKSKGLSQQSVADRMKVTRSCITNWERGIRSIMADDLYKLCDIYNLDINEISSKLQRYLYKWASSKKRMELILFAILGKTLLLKHSQGLKREASGHKKKQENMKGHCQENQA